MLGAPVEVWRLRGVWIVVMTCRNVATLRDRHLDGELSPSLSAEMHAHLLQCPACQRQFEMFRTAGEVIARDRSEPKLRADFAAGVVARMSKAPASRNSQPIRLHTRRDLRERFWRLAFSVSVPAAAAILFLGVLIWPISAPTKSRGLVAGYVSTRATDAAGVNDVATPAVDAVNETMRTARSLTQMRGILVDQARPGPGEAPAVSTETVAKPEMTLLNALLFPFNEALEPETPETIEDEGVVRF